MPSNSKLGAMGDGGWWYTPDRIAEMFDEYQRQYELEPREISIDYGHPSDMSRETELTMSFNVIGRKAMNMKVMLEAGAIAPTRAHRSDAAIDLYAPYDVIVPAHGWGTVNTGVHIQLPEGWCGLLVSRSGLNRAHGITSTGLIDPGYTGGIGVTLHNDSSKEYQVKKGDRISQLLLLRCERPTLELVGELEETERGAGGFGSTGR